MSLQSFIDSVDGRSLSLVVVNRDSPQPVQSMLENLFGDQPIEIEERQLPDGDRDVV